MPRHARRRRRVRFAPDLLESRRLPTTYPAFPVDATTAGSQSEARTAVDFMGRVTVVWEAEDGSGLGVYARRFESGGYPLGDAVLVNDSVAGDQTWARVAQDPAGGTVVAWWSAAVYYFRRYDVDGRPLGPVRMMEGIAGRVMSFELTEADAQGFTVFTSDLRLRRYDNDGVQRSSTTIAAASDGWTFVESTDPRRVTADWYVWTRVRTREEGGATVYDAQVLVTALDAERAFDGDPIQVVASTLGSTDPALLEGFEPAILHSGLTVIAWREPSGGPYRARELVPILPVAGPMKLAPQTLDLEDDGGGEPLWVGMLGGAPIAADLVVAFASPGAGAPAYTRTWAGYRSTQREPSGWQRRPPAPMADVEGGPFDAIDLFKTFDVGPGGPYWILRRAVSGNLIAQRVDSDGVREPFFIRTPTQVPEAAGRAVIWLVRLGDISRAASYDYVVEAGPPGRDPAHTAIPGVDFIPTSGTVTFEPGRSEASIIVTILDDQVPEGTKMIDVSLGPPGTDPAGWTLDHQVAIADDEPAALRDLTFFDYGADGFWSWDEIEGWRKLNHVDPVAFVATPDRQAFVSFGAAGLWRWDILLGWTKLNDLGPEALTYGLHAGGEPAGATPPDDTIILDYGPAGLWTWSGPADGWRKISHVDPVRMVATGDYLFVDFGAGGLWAWDPDQVVDDGYTFISAYRPEAMAAHERHVYLDYGPAGLWSWGGAPGSWTHINAADPASMAVGPTGLFVDYGPYGFWRWDASAGMTLLSTHSPSAFAPAKESLYAGFAAFGLLEWKAETGWADVNPVDPAMIYAAIDQADAILDFGPSGLWRWDPASGWRKLDRGPAGVPTSISPGTTFLPGGHP